MGIEYEDLRAILTALKRSVSRDSLLILGDAFIHCDLNAYISLGRSAGYPIASRPRNLDPFTLGSSLGFRRIETLDVNGKCSLTVDLHKDVPDSLMEQFDCVIDAGVLFWCFDPAAALKNILKMARPGGLIIHITAVSGHYGRGYYNIHPLLLEDFYRSNNCEFIQSSFRTKFVPQGILERIYSLFGVRNSISYSFRPGNVYLGKSRINRISFQDIYRHPRESNMLPNNVLGVFIFRKLATGEIKVPLRVSCYDKDAEDKGMRQ